MTKEDAKKIILGTGSYKDVKCGNTVSVTGDGGNAWNYFGPAYKKLAPKLVTYVPYSEKYKKLLELKKDLLMKQEYINYRKEIEEEKIESTSIVENVQTKNNLVETNEEHTSKITKDDYINMIKLFKTSNFKQMMSNLGSKESIIISLRMGYIDGKYFSVDAIAEFLDIERDEVSKIIKEVLLNYKESVIKSIDHAIEVASDEQNVLKDEKDIKEKKYRKI